MKGSLTKILLLLMCVTMTGMIHAQSDVFRIPGGTLEEGQTAQFPIYFQDISGSGVDTGTTNVGSFSIEIIVPAGLVASASFQRAGVIEDSPVLIESDLSDLSQNKLAWYVAFQFGSVPFFTLDAPDPGELICYLTITATAGTSGSLLTLTSSVTETYVQDELGGITNSVENGKLIADFNSINIISSGGGSKPQINAFSLDPASIQAGASSTLSWNVSDADTVSVDHGIGAVSATGSQSVSPTVTTTYTLTATNANGTSTAQATLNVSQPQGPEINSFTVSPTSIESGQSATLSWDTSNADTLSLTPAVPGMPNPLPATGNIQITPSETTTYTLIARNGVGTANRSVTVIVSVPQGKPTINTFLASPDKPEKGANYDVSWSVDGGTDTTLLTLETNDAVWNEISELQDSRSFKADTSRFFKLTASNSYGSDSKTIYVEVQGVFEIVSFEARKTAVFKGQEVALSWFVTNADQIFIEPQVGTVAAEGQANVLINKDESFTLTATRGEEEKVSTIQVEVLNLEEGQFLYIPLVRDDADWYTRIGLVNLSPVQTKFDIYRFDQKGNPIEFFTNKKLNPLESMSMVFDTQKEDLGWLKIWNKNDDVGSVGIFGWANLISRDGKQLAAYPASRLTDQTLLVPHLAKDSSFYTMGAAVSGIHGGEAFFHSSGKAYSLGTLEESHSSMWDFRTLMNDDLGQDGWGRLTGDNGTVQKLSALEIFGRSPQTGMNQAVGISLDGQTSNELVFTHIAKDVNKFWTGCVVINPGQASVNLEILVYNDEGELLEGPASEQLASGAKKTILVDRNQNGLATGASWAVFRADAPLFGYMLFGSYAPDDFFSGFQSVKSPSRTLCFPDVEMSREVNKSQGGWTGLALVNNNPLENQVRLILVDESGEQKGISEIALAPRKKMIGLITSIFQTNTIEKGDKIMAYAAEPIAGFELYGKNSTTLGGILAFPWNFE